MAKISRIINLSNLTLLVALALSSVAAYYSIIGLTAIFAGAIIPIIVMGGILEVGKITTTVWLRKYWGRAGWLLKLYLVPAVIALALLTSMGIFGFLSKAHMDQGITSGDVQAKIAIYDEKIKTSQDNIDVNRKALKQLDEAVDQVMGRSTSETGADKAVAIRKSQAKERTRLLAEITAEQKTITALREERAPIAAEVRKVEAEVGPIKYIAALIYGDNADQNMLEAAVRWVIILLVIVFDPLAIALVLAANASREWDKEEGDSPLGNETPSTPTVTEPSYEPDDGPLTEEQIEQIKESVNEPINCYMCGTPLVNAPGIGPFCPNKQCDVMDNTEGVEWRFTKPENSMLEQHPYLSKPFINFDVKPMVAPKEVQEQPKKKRVKKEVTPDPEPEPAVIILEPSEIVTEGVTKSFPWENVDENYVKYDGRVIQREALHQLKPELFMLTADHMKQVKTNFGTTFPKISNKGDIFVRVDALPNRVYKFNGTNWIVLDKNITTSYLYDQEYVKYLVDKVGSGEYDLDLLSEKEREQIEDYLGNQKS